MDVQKLLQLIESDEHKILSIKSKTTNTLTSEDRLIASFQEINKFIRKKKREPRANRNEIQEFKLYTRLNEFRANDDKAKIVKKYDEFSLLKNIKQITSLNDIFQDDDLGLFKDDPNSIFNLKHIPKPSIATPDYIAKRKPCKDFENYEHLFKQCQNDLSTGKRHIMPFANIIEKKHFYVLKGILLYVAEMGPSEIVNGRTNARLRCIFENGTESDTLMRSLSAELYKNGKLVTENEDRLLDGFDNVMPEDTEAGYIYIVKSLSTLPQITSFNNLYKIGFSRNPPQERLKNANQDPTFLMAPVKLIISYRCFNINPQKLELLLHRFFGEACLDINVFDDKGKCHKPREWFIASIQTIEQVIKLILNGNIGKYHYNIEQQEIIFNESIAGKK